MTPPTSLPWAEERPDHKGRFDELVCRDVSMVHVEMLDDGLAWIGIYGAGGRVTLTFSSRIRLRVNVTHEADDLALAGGEAGR